MNEQTMTDAVRLLRALNKNQAHDSSRTPVCAGIAEEAVVGFGLGSLPYKAATDLLLGEGYLIEDHETERIMANVVGASDFYRITGEGFTFVDRIKERGL